MHELNEEIGKLLAKAEQLGAEGNVDEAQKVLQEVEKVRTRKKDAEVRKECFGSFVEGGVFCSSVPQCLFLYFHRKNTETPCQPQASSNKSFEYVKCALLTLGCMTMIVVWPTISVENFIWVSSRSERNWTN